MTGLGRKLAQISTRCSRRRARATLAGSAAAVGACFAVASAAALTQGHTYTLNVGDYVRVADAHGFDGVICYRSPNAVPLESIKCYVADANGDKPLSYFGFVTAASTGVYRIDAQGNSHLVWRRSNAPSGAAGSGGTTARGEGMLNKTTLQRDTDRAAFGKPYTLGLGDTAVVAGSSVHCFNDPTARPPGTVACYVHDGASKSGNLVGSYSILINWHEITVWKAKADGTFTQVYAHLEPAS